MLYLFCPFPLELMWVRKSMCVSLLTGYIDICLGVMASCSFPSLISTYYNKGKVVAGCYTLLRSIL